MGIKLMVKKTKRIYRRKPTTFEGKAISLADMDKLMGYNSVGNLPSLISDLTSTIDTLEAQLTAQIDRIKSILN